MVVRLKLFLFPEVKQTWPGRMNVTVGEKVESSYLLKVSICAGYTVHVQYVCCFLSEFGWLDRLKWLEWAQMACTYSKDTIQLIQDIRFESKISIRVRFESIQVQFSQIK